MSKGGIMFKYRKHVSRAGNRLIGGLEELCKGGGREGTTGTLEWKRGQIPPASPLAQNWSRCLDQAGGSTYSSDVSKMTNMRQKAPHST